MILIGALGCPLLLMFAHAALAVFRHNMMTLAHLPLGSPEAYIWNIFQLLNSPFKERERERELVRFLQLPRG